MRYDYIQLSKALGIVLMVLGHSGFWPYENPFVYAFHMPLFFFLSGYCFKDANTKEPITYILKKVRGVYIPYVKWSLAFLLLHNLFLYYNVYSTIYGAVHFNIKDILHHVYTIGFTMSGHESLLGGFWFLKYLFFASVVMLYIRQRVSNEFVSLGGVIILTQIFASCGLRIPYWGLNFTLFMSLSYMIAGFIYHQYDEWLQKHTTLLTFGCLVIVVLGSLFWPGSMLTISSLYCVPYIISGIAGSIMVLEICRFLANKISPRCYAIWKYVGDNTLIVLCLHMLCFKLVSLIIVVIYHLPAYRIAEFITIHDFSIKGWWLLYVLVGTLMPLGIQLLYKHAHTLITRKWNLYKPNKHNS